MKNKIIFINMDILMVSENGDRRKDQYNVQDRI